MKKRTIHYKTLRGFMRAFQDNQFSVSDFLDGHYWRRSDDVQVYFKLSDEALMEFVKGICWAMDAKQIDRVFDNLKNHKIKDCGILRRLRCEKYPDGKIGFTYCAGQEAISESMFVRRKLYCY